MTCNSAEQASSEGFPTTDDPSNVQICGTYVAIQKCMHTALGGTVALGTIN